MNKIKHMTEIAVVWHKGIIPLQAIRSEFKIEKSVLRINFSTKDMLLETTLKAPDFDRYSKHEDTDCYIVDDKGLSILLDIEKIMQKLKVMGSDNRRSLWLEIPRGLPEDWRSYEDFCEYDESEDTYGKYLESWKADHPAEVEWWEISSCWYKEFHYLLISDGEYYNFSFKSADNVPTKREDSGPFCDESEILEKIRGYVEDAVGFISKNPDTYNSYVNANISPYKKKGVIERKMYNSLIPDECLKGIDKAKAFKRLCEKVEPTKIDEMTIRTYAHYWRIGYEALGYANGDMSDMDIFMRSPASNYIGKLSLDIERSFLTWRKRGEAYHLFDIVYACVHLTPVKRNGSWILVLSTGSYWHLGDLLKAYISFCNKGIYVDVCPKETILSVLQETDYIGITPDPHRGFGEDGVSSEESLPWPDSEISQEVIGQIVAHTKWEDMERVEPI